MKANAAKYQMFLGWCAFVLLSWWWLYHVSDFNGLYGMDAHEYYRFSQKLTDWIKTGTAPGSFFWPVNYPLAGALLALILRDTLLAMQCISCLSLLAGGIFLYDILSTVYKRSNANNFTLFIFISLTWFLSPFIWRGGFIIMSDLMGAALALGALRSFVHYQCKGSQAALLGFGIFSGLAIMTRYPVFVLLFLPGMAILYQAVRQRQWSGIILSGVLALMACVPHLVLRWQAPAEFLGHAWIKSWSPFHFFGMSSNSKEGYVAYRFPNLMHAVQALAHPGFCSGMAVILISGIWGNAKKQFMSIPVSARWIGASWLLYSFFLAGIPYQNNRYLLIGYPFLLILCCHFWNQAIRVTAIWKKAALITAVFVPQVFFIPHYTKQYIQRSHLEKKLAAAVSKHEGNPVYIFGVDMALKSYGIDREYRNLWMHDYPDFEKGALALFSEAAFEQQWKGRTPMINWERLESRHRLDTLEVLPEGWHLFRIGD